MSAAGPIERPLRPRRIGLFGGSFDPVHAGHIHAARAALRVHELDRVVFVPAAEPPHKLGTRLADGRHRLAMLELATSGEAAFEVSSLELDRGGRSYTIDTVRALPAAIGEPEGCEIYLILGTDNLAGLATWRDAAALIDRVQPVVIHRDDESCGSQGEESALASVALHLGLERAEKVRRGRVVLPPVRVSATRLRGELARGVSFGGELDPAVQQYIERHGLYRTDA
jgi:nicotinate-nucleotide adenylyltransferase